MNAYFKQIQGILESNDFKEALERINDNFPNLKQEHLIRDVILTMYNQKYSSDYKAFSEHPRKWKLSNGEEKKGRVDLALYKTKDIENPYKIEIKFYFTGDIKDGRNNSVKYNYLEKECDLLMIIVQEFIDIEEKKSYDDFWGIDSKLYRYQLKGEGNEESKFTSLEDSFKKGIESRQGTIYSKIVVSVNKPYKTRYTFCFLERKK